MHSKSSEARRSAPSISTLLLISLVLLTGCTCNGDKNKKTATDSLLAIQSDSLHIDSLAREENRQMGQFMFDSLTTNWLSGAMGGRKVDTTDFANDHAPNAVSDSTGATQDPAIGQLGDSTKFSPSAGFYRDYAQVLRWAPDSSYLLDLGSYGNVPVKGKDGKVRLEGGEPDTRIVVIDPKKGVQWQVLFGGPGLRILDGKWKDKNHFMLLYTHDAGRHADTLLILGNMQTRHLHWYGLNQH